MLVGHVLEVAVHHGDGVDVAAGANVSNGEILGGGDAHVDHVRVGLVGSVGVRCGVVLAETIVFDDGDVVVCTRVGDLAGSVVKALASQKEDVVVGG